MSAKNWWITFILQIFGIGWALLVFASPMSKVTAGLLAGVVFLIIGLFPLWALRKDPHRMRWIIFWSALIFLICSAVPILGLRILFWGQEFNSIEIGSFQAAQLHGWSQSFYLAMIVSHLWDGIRFFLMKRFKVKPKI